MDRGRLVFWASFAWGVTLGGLSGHAVASPGDIGTVEKISGDAAIVRHGEKPVPVSAALGVRMSDEVETGRGEVSISFEDDTRVEVSEHSILVIDEFVYDPATTSGALALKATLGTLRYVSGKIAKHSPEDVVIRTPTASVAVRGTEFTASVDEIGRSTIVLLPSCDITGVNCVVGAIEVSTDSGFVLLNQAYQMTYVDAASVSPTSPLVIDVSIGQIGGDLILGGPKLGASGGRDNKVEDGQEVFEASFFVDQLSTDLLDSTEFLAETTLIDELNVDLFENSLDVIEESIVGNSAQAASSNLGDGSTVIADSDTGKSVVQETETTIVGLNLSSSGSQTVILDNAAGGGAAIDVGGGGGASITIVQRQ